MRLQRSRWCWNNCSPVVVAGRSQYGGILHGVKLLESESGFLQQPQVSWLPESIFRDSLQAPCHLLYYTGITRVAKNILGEIVRSMFLNEGQHLSILHEMKSHAKDMAECIQRGGELDRYGKLVLKSWQQNNALDKGTNPREWHRSLIWSKIIRMGTSYPVPVVEVISIWLPRIRKLHCGSGRS